MEIPAISVKPEKALVDEEQIIIVRGLKANQYISVHVRTSVESGAQFASLGCYRANNDGVVDVSKDESIQGTYTGVDSMGLFWSLSAEPGFERRRFMKIDVSTPIVYSIFVYNGLYTLNEIQNCPKASIATTTVKRYYRDKNVTRKKMREGMVVGVLFIPEGKGPFPAVIDMFGGIGGIVETRATLLASRGFLTLALPYIFYEDLPSPMEIFKNFVYFKENVEWLSNHPLALPRGIGVVGVSAGGYFANILACKFQQVKACVLINCPVYYPIRPVYMDISFKIPMNIEYDSARFVETPEGIETKNMYPHYEERISKSWEESNAKYLCILGDDDKCVNPSYIEDWYDVWPPHQKHRIKVLKYQDAGHLIEPPYTPLNRVTFAKDINDFQVWGGKPEGHAYSQKDSWKQILSFLRENLTQKQKRFNKSNL